MSQNTTTLHNATDTSISEGAPTRNFSESTRLRLRSGSGATNYAFIHFTRPCPLGATVKSATLRVYGAGSWEAATRTITAKRVTAGWKVGHLTWNSAGAGGPSVVTTGQDAVTKSGVRADGDMWEFDVTALVQDWANGVDNFGIRLGTDDTTFHKLYSANGANAYKPTLEVTYTLAPDQPTGLHPDGNQQVSGQFPTLSFDYTDQFGSELQAIQVQINTADTWTAPTFDSGTVFTTEPELDLSTTAFAGVNALQTLYWRVRAQDTSGNWSLWSDSAQFGRTDKGALTITNPGASPNNYVETSTPAISWTPPANQTSWRVFIRDSAGEEIYDSGPQAGTDTQHEIKKKVITSTTETYTAVVRVHDNVDRASSGSDKPFYHASQDFTYQRSVSVSPVTNLTATNLSPFPGVQLDWQRSVEPAFYKIIRIDDDGNVTTVDENIDASDLLMSGTSYQYKDHEVDPQQTYTYEVIAKVGNQESLTNPQVSVLIQPIGIWLVDRENGLFVPILDADEGTWEMDEDSESFTPLGARTPVRVTQSLRGFSGSITGRIMDYNNVSCKTYERRLWTMKSNTSSRYVLVLSNKSIPVHISNVVIAPSPEAEIVKEVSFNFEQIDNFDFRGVVQ